jgi:hypothetical protein
MLRHMIDLHGGGPIPATPHLKTNETLLTLHRAAELA